MLLWLRWLAPAAIAAVCGLSPSIARGQSLSGPYAAEAAADRAVGRIGASVGRIRRGLDEARNSRDVVRVTCLNDKLVQASAAERSANERRSRIRVGDEDAAQEIAAFDALVARAEQLVAEANQCVGQQAAFVGGSTVVQADGKNVRSEYLVRERDLEQRVDALKDQVSKEKARLELVNDTVLGGLASGVRGPTAAAPAAATPATPPQPPPPASPYAREGAHDASMLIRTADLTLAVYEVEKNLDAVEQTARELGGYLANRSDMQVSIRIPRERFDDALKRIEKLGDVLHRNVAAEDVTDQYVDIEMRLKNAYAVRARLEELLKQATVKDAIEIQKELAKTTEEIERLEGKIKLLRDRISFSTITVTFERTQPQRAVQNRALLPFPWMNTMGLGPLLTVPR